VKIDYDTEPRSSTNELHSRAAKKAKPGSFSSRSE
jgi:hypothetical protein